MNLYFAKVSDRVIKDKWPFSDRNADVLKEFVNSKKPEYIHFNHRRLKFYVLTHNNPKNPEYLIAISLLQVRRLNYLFDNFGAQLQAPVF